MKDYAANFQTDAVAFPATGAKNATGPSATDGTEFKKLMIDDEWGARQALMAEANLVPDGVSEAVGTAQSLAAMIALFRTQAGVQRGLEMSNNAVDAVNDLDVAAGVALSDAAPNRAISLAAAITKRLDATWAEGTGAGGRAAGVALASTTWYHVFAMGKDAGDGQVDIGFDTSITAANLKADGAVTAALYTTYQRIGSIYRIDGVTGINPFHQYGDEIRWDTVILESSAVVVWPTAQVITTPPDIKTKAILTFVAQFSTTTFLYAGSLDGGEQLEVGRVNSQSNLSLSNRTIFTNTIKQINWGHFAGFVTAIQEMQLEGYIDPRGKY